MENSGLARWRQVGDHIVEDIDSGALQPGSQLPPTRSLAQKFGVDRNTVLRAISHLQDVGLLRVEQGRGTFVVENAIEYRMGSRTTFEDNLSQLNFVPARRIISILNMPASEDIAKLLEIKSGDSVTEVSLLGQASGIPVNYGRYYFPVERVPDIEKHIRSAASKGDGRIFIAELFQKHGIFDFRRDGLRIRTRAPSPDVAHALKVPRSEYVLEVRAVNRNSDDKPIMYAIVFHAGSRVEFVLDF